MENDEFDGLCGLFMFIRSNGITDYAGLIDKLLGDSEVPDDVGNCDFYRDEIVAAFVHRDVVCAYFQDLRWRDLAG